MSQRLSALPIGARVRDINTRYFGQQIIFNVVARNHPGYPADSVTLQTDRILCLKAFDANEPNNTNSDRRSWGNNRYIHSNLRQWLNSVAAANAWYTAQHGADEPPIAARLWDGHNPYQNEAGFLTNLSPEMRAALLPTTLTVARNTVTDGGGSETCVDRVFLASNTEMGLANENGIAEGTQLAAYSNDASRISIPTPQAVSNSTWQGSGFSSTEGRHYWLRTPAAPSAPHARLVHSAGQTSNTNAFSGHFGVRPLLNLPSEILVSDSMIDGAFNIVWIPPPTAPNGITTPSHIIRGQNAVISWGIATDPENTVTGYILERAANGGTFTQIYRGANRTHTDTIQENIDTVQYRVRAFNNHSIEGANTTSAVLSAITANPPVISGSDTDLGLQTGAFNQAYTVTNPDAHHIKTLTVTERISGRVKREFVATSGAQNTFEVTAADWLEILNGSNTLSINALDSFGLSATRTFNFSKNVSELEFTLATPLAADDAVRRVVMNITRQIPDGADFSVEVCNNAFDNAPAWEDITAAIKAGSAFTLSNAAKTAANWGFNVRVRANRRGALGELYVRGIGGNFE